MATTPTSPDNLAAVRPAARPDPRPDRRRSRRGQSLAEFALTVPIAMLMVLFGLDFGRVFLGWVALNNAAREAANYAGLHPTGWGSPPDTTVQAEYARLVSEEASNINCTLVEPIADPSFPDGTSIGAPVQVELHCAFDLITPLIGLLMGNPIPVGASSAFPIRSGLIEGVPVPTASPAPSSSASASASPSPTGSSGPGSSASASSSPSPSASAIVTPTATPTATATSSPGASASAAVDCTVPSLIGVQTNKATQKWKEAGFTGLVIFSPLVPPNYRIEWQSETANTSITCTSGITVRSSAP